MLPGFFGGRRAAAQAQAKQAADQVGISQVMKEPHYAEPEAVLNYYKVDHSTGLTTAEVELRRAVFGRNMLAGKKGVSPVVLFLHHLFNVMTFILFAALAIACSVQEWIEAVVIAFVILTNAIIGFMQEYRSEQTMQALRRLSSPLARVIRDNGKVSQVPADELVPGDLVQLEEGDQAPADARILETISLASEEAILTGESVAISKVSEAVAPPAVGGDCPVGDRKCMVFFGCTMTRGRGKAVVTGTGMQTELGRIAKSLDDRTNGKTQLQKQLERLAMGLFVLALILGGVVIAVNNFTVSHEVLLYAIALGVAIIPEGLVAVVTVAMAMGVKRMANANTIVRKLAALEALGAVTDICSDKTGTLTLAKMTATSLWLPPDKAISISGVGLRPVGDLTLGHKPITAAERESDADLSKFLVVCALCSSSSLNKPKEEDEGLADAGWAGVGDSTEIALLVLAAKAGLSKAGLCSTGYSFVAEFPFDSTIKRMSVAYQKGTHITLMAKGAIESIYSACDSISVNGALVPLQGSTAYSLPMLQKQVDKLAGQGLRVLALACKNVVGAWDRKAEREEVEVGLTFLGLVGMYDPPRPETRGAVEACLSAGITVRMVTGDHPRTAAFIADSISITEKGASQRPGVVMPAWEFDAMADAELDRLVDPPLVLARCSPATKVKIIDALHRRHRVVAMTGDGVNDAPSLRAADIGIAMGRNGSDVTKQAADIVITDDNFSTIEKAVEEGRRISANIVKFVVHLLTSNMAEMVALLIGLAFKDRDGLSTYPMTPLQILWVNMVTSSPPALGLACEAAEDDIMQRPPVGRTNMVLSKPVLVDTAVYGVFMGLLALFNFLLVTFWLPGGVGTANTANCNRYLNDECLHIFRARSTSFGTLQLLLLLHAWNCKNLRKSLFSMHLLDNPWLLRTTLLGIVTMIPTFYVPFLYEKVFYQAPITWEWALIIGASIIFLLFAEAYKAFFRDRFLGMNAGSPSARGKAASSGHDYEGVEVVVSRA